MVATKVLISLCVYGLAAAAPQLGQTLNQEVIVNDVVTALQPSIAEAVANALRGLSTTVTSFNSGSAGLSGSSSSSTKSGFSSTGFSSNSGSSTGFSSNSGSATGSASRFAAGGAAGFGANSGSASGFAANSGSASGFAANSGSAASKSVSASGFAANSGSAAGFAAGRTSSNAAAVKAAAEDEMEIMTRPEYAYQFNVADDDFQTYINQQENRDGETVVGTYSYVDPLGALITVNYQAGPDGYTQTVETEEGFVTISEENKARMNSAAVASNAAAGLSVLSSNSAFGSTAGSAAGVAAGAVSKLSAGGSASKFAVGGSATKFAAGGAAAGSAAGSASQFAAGGSSASKFAAGGSTSSSFGSGSAFGSNSSGQKYSTVSTTTSALDQEALIAQILAVLQPQISSAVNTAVRQQQSTVTTTSFKSVGQTGF